MVLENCKECMAYWLKKGRDMAGYRYLVCDQHIPGVHDEKTKEAQTDALDILERDAKVEQKEKKKQKEEEEREAETEEKYGKKPETASHINPLYATMRELSDSFIDALEKLDREAEVEQKQIQKQKKKEREEHKQKEEEWEAETEEKYGKKPETALHINPLYATMRELSESFIDDIEREIMKQKEEVEGEAEEESGKKTEAAPPIFPQVGASSESFADWLPDSQMNIGMFDSDTADYKFSCPDIEFCAVGVYEGLSGTSWYFSLYNAAMSGDWKKGKEIFQNHPQALRAKIRRDSETALHVAVGSGPGATLFVQGLLQLLQPVDLEMTDNDGCTPLGIAAKVGNVEAAKLLVAKNRNLLYISDGRQSFPIHSAAEYGQKEMLLYLRQVTQEGHCPDPYDPVRSGPELLRLIIKAGFYDEALHLLEVIPRLATSGIESNLALAFLAENPSAFSCGRNRGVFQRLIYKCVPEPQRKQSYQHVSRDIEKAENEENLSALQKLLHVLWKIFEEIAPLLKDIKNERRKHNQAKKLVKRLCTEAAKKLGKTSDAALLFKFPLLMAAENGIHEIVKEVTHSFPDAIWYYDNNNSAVFRLAIENRHHKVYNQLYEMGDQYRNIVRQSGDDDGNNILHLAGRLAPSDRLSIVSGAALQVQRELQWFKEIESLVQPSYRSKRNKQGKTPQEVFRESHRDLMVEGEKWMKETANSCTVAAALIATIVFAAAVTVPGGNSGENGKPLFALEKGFTIFGVADAFSLLTSSISILMFLSILTSRYAEVDFLRALPTRLIIGRLTLFISIASMMVAFGSALHLTFGNQKTWILVSVTASCCLPVAIFAFMQFSLLAEMIRSTYGSGIFKKRSKRKGRRPLLQGMLNRKY